MSIVEELKNLIKVRGGDTTGIITIADAINVLKETEGGGHAAGDYKVVTYGPVSNLSEFPAMNLPDRDERDYHGYVNYVVEIEENEMSGALPVYTGSSGFSGGGTQGNKVVVGFNDTNNEPGLTCYDLQTCLDGTNWTDLTQFADSIFKSIELVLYVPADINTEEVGD